MKELYYVYTGRVDYYIGLKHDVQSFKKKYSDLKRIVERYMKLIPAS